MRISIIPELINLYEIKIYDENLIPISICESSMFKFDLNSFKRPSISVDIIEAAKYKEVEIKRIQLPEIDKYGHRLVAIPLVKSNKNIRNYPGQKTAYILKRKSDPLEGGVEMGKVPTDHYIEMDIINKRLRIRGRNAYPYLRNENASKWVNITNEEI